MTPPLTLGANANCATGFTCTVQALMSPAKSRAAVSRYLPPQMLMPLVCLDKRLRLLAAARWKYKQHSFGDLRGEYPLRLQLGFLRRIDPVHALRQYGASMIVIHCALHCRDACMCLVIAVRSPTRNAGMRRLAFRRCHLAEPVECRGEVAMKIFAIGLLSLACQMTFGATIEFVGITTLSHGKSLSGDGSAISGMSHSADGLGGYSLATVQTGAASASASWYWPFGWYDWSKGQVWDTWRLELQLSGAPSEQAEIFADLSFLAGSVLTAYPSGLYASGSTAHGYSNMGIEIFGLNDGTPFNYTQSFLYDEAVVWMGAGGGVDSASYSTSLGIFGVGSLFYVDVSAHGFATAYANPHGSVAANLWSNSTLKLSPESLPTPVPVPGTLGLLGLGLAGLGLIRRGQHRAST